MHFVITGGRGFLGQHVGAYLRNQGHSVTCLSRSPGDDLIAASYEDEAGLTRALADCDVLLHFAGIAHARLAAASAEQAYHDGIVTLSNRLWRASLAAGVRRFVFASSVKVYGEQAPDGPLSEASPCHPVTPYGRAKLEAERQLMGAAAGGGPLLTIVRFPPMYGPGMKGAVRHLFRAARWRLPLPLHGYPSERSFLYVGNAARLVSAIAEGGLEDGLYLPHDGEVWQLGEFYASIFCAMHGREMPRAMRWPLPRPFGDRLNAFSQLRPLVAPMALASRARHAYERLPFLSASRAFAEMLASGGEVS